MEHNLKKRKYKDAKASDTIQKIRSILNKMDCFTYESIWCNLIKGVYSVRVETQGDFGTNGKGKTREYALASAYAEFLERYQNNMYRGVTGFTRIIHNHIKKETGFYFYPDEKILSKSDFLNLPEIFLLDLEKDLGEKREILVDMYFNRLESNGYKGVVSVPFYDIKNDKTIYLPFNLLHGLVGSNGMCAGNTASEAIFQGICEILERYAVDEIYNKRITPPSIPRDYLKGFPEYEIIKNIEKSGIYKVIIKDFSAGKKLPCIASMIINEKTKKYRLNVGSDTNFSIALSRTLTELFQGVGDKDRLEKVLLPIPQKEHDYFLKSDAESLDKRYQETLKFKKDGSGVFPKSLFNDMPDYEFDPSTFNNGDIPYDIGTSNLLNFVTELGFETYIRDVSFLGFPSYHVFIPALSILGKKNMSATKQFSSEVDKTISLDEIEDLFFPINTINSERINKLIPLLETPLLENPSEKIKGTLKLNFKNESIWSRIPISYFLVIFNYIIQDFEKSLKYLDIFIKDFKVSKETYYKVVKALMKFKILELDDSNIKDKLNKKFNPKVVAEVLNNFNNNNDLLNGVIMPQCPNCSKCNLSADCNTRELIDLNIKFNNLAKDLNINQLDLSSLKQLDLSSVQG